MSFFVLNPRDDAAKWANLVDLLPAHLRDVHFSPGFMAAQAMLGHDPRLAVYTYENYVVVQPIIVRDIEIGGKWTGYRDIASTVGGFGGPASNHGGTLYQWFAESFTMWCRDNKIVSEFCALHPMLIEHQKKLLAGGPKLRERKQVVVLDLNADYAAKYHDNRRQGLQKARRAGLDITTAGVHGCDALIRLYREAMTRKHAAERWHLPDEHLRALFAMGTVVKAYTPDGSIASAALMLSRGQTAYYHLAANSPDHSKTGANELVVHWIAQEAKRRGCRWLHLGGGVTLAPDDPVLFFKGGFSDLRRPAMSYFRVFDPSVYKQLCVAKMEDEVDKTGAEFTTSFEPLYRRETI